MRERMEVDDFPIRDTRDHVEIHVLVDNDELWLPA